MKLWKPVDLTSLPRIYIYYEITVVLSLRNEALSQSWKPVAVTLPICYGCINERCIISRLSVRNLLYSFSLHLSRHILFECITTFARRKVGEGELFWCIFMIKATRCTNFSNLFWNETLHHFGQFLCPSSGVFYCTHSNGISYTGLLTARKLSANLYDIYHCCVYSKKTLMMDRGTNQNINRVSFQNKFEKLVHLVGFIIRICHDARSHERRVVMHSIHTLRTKGVWKFNKFYF